MQLLDYLFGWFLIKANFSNPNRVCLIRYSPKADEGRHMGLQENLRGALVRCKAVKVRGFCLEDRFAESTQRTRYYQLKMER